MFLLGKTYYPDFFRCIYIEAYRYNLHLCKRSMCLKRGDLFRCGGVGAVDEHQNIGRQLNVSFNDLAVKRFIKADSASLGNQITGKVGGCTCEEFPFINHLNG